MTATHPPPIDYHEESPDPNILTGAALMLRRLFKYWLSSFGLLRIPA